MCPLVFANLEAGCLEEAVLRDVPHRPSERSPSAPDCSLVNISKGGERSPAPQLWDGYHRPACGMGTITQPIHQEVTGQRGFGETSGFILLKSIFFLFGPPHQTPAMPTGCREGWGRSRLQPRPHPSP